MATTAFILLEDDGKAMSSSFSHVSRRREGSRTSSGLLNSLPCYRRTTRAGYLLLSSPFPGSNAKISNLVLEEMDGNSVSEF